MKLTGHKTPSMFQRYNTVDLDDAQSAYQKLEGLLGKDQEWVATRADVLRWYSRRQKPKKLKL